MKLEMKCTEEELMNSLVECYTYWLKKAVDYMPDDDSESPYEAAQAIGATEALQAIMLQVFGGKTFYEIWEKTMTWANGVEE